MRKRVFGRKFSRERTSRKALFRSLVRGLVLRGKIKTTLPKAKAIQPMVEKIMTKVGKNGVFQRRVILSKLGGDKETLKTLFEKYLFLAKKRSSGFTRIVRLGTRRGDSAQMAIVEWIEAPEEKKEGKKVKKKTKPAKKTEVEKK